MPVNHVLLETIELTQSAASVTFDNIPQAGYTDLKIVMSVRGGTGNSNYDPIGVKVNGSTPSQQYKSLGGTGSGTVAFGASNDTFTASTAGGTWARMSSSGTQPGVTTANVFSNDCLYLANYTSTLDKAWSYDTATENNATQAYVEMTAGSFVSTTGITSIAFALRDGSFVAGSTFSLYGIAATGTTPVTAPLAQGGNIVANDGTYWYHAFLASGTFTPTISLTCDVLVVAGGGSGGAGGNSGGAGGGGAGGLLYFSSQSVTSQSMVTVGAGAAAIATTGGNALNGSTGSDSQFASLTLVKGGGYGGGGRLNDLSYSIGGTGGSGGGAGRWSDSGTVNGGAATSGQGNPGGNSSTTGGGRGSGGGGGAGAAGTNGVSTTNNDGAGGAGVNTYSAWATATSTGVSGYYAGGGGGSSVYTSNGTGGAGGGGAGGTAATGSAQTATSGTRNTGGGGGGMGGADASVLKTSGAGGSGIVIIRYAMA